MSFSSETLVIGNNTRYILWSKNLTLRLNDGQIAKKPIANRGMYKGLLLKKVPIIEHHQHHHPCRRAQWRLYKTTVCVADTWSINTKTQWRRAVCLTNLEHLLGFLCRLIVLCSDAQVILVVLAVHATVNSLRTHTQAHTRVDSFTWIFNGKFIGLNVQLSRSEQAGLTAATQCILAQVTM